MTRRRFNGRERVALFMASGGTCVECGAPLNRGFHADHVIPYAAGGPTDVANGQALCPTCNLRKGATLIPPIDLRDWQRESIATYRRLNKPDYLQVATPGAGKTTFALNTAQMLMGEGVVRRLIVVVPTNHLRTQWRAAAERFSLKLSAEFSNKDGRPALDYDGIVVTYQSVASLPELYRHLSSTVPTLVVFDEIHHAGDKKGWGDAIQLAFERSARRLAITGTPFRAKGERIPFVRYGDDGRLEAESIYDYTSALRDGVCREVYFHTFEGEFEWQEITARQSTTFSATFADELNSSEESQRLRTALSTETEWLPNVIIDADRRLRSIRENEFPEAAGLIIAMDREHALRIARLVKKHIGVEPFVAISDNPENEQENPSDIIRRFGEGDESITGDVYRNIPRWLVAVKMVSEGVDIPRLCVGVYASNVTSEMFFRQAVGRFVREVPQATGVSAALFVPKDSRLVAHMERIQEEVEVYVQEDEEREREEQTERERLESVGDRSYEAIRADAHADSIIIGDEVFSAEYIAKVRAWLIREGYESVALEIAAKLYRSAERDTMASAGIVQTTPVETVITKASRSLDEERKELRGRVVKAVNRLSRRTGAEAKSFYAELKRQQNVAQAQATRDQLEERLTIVQGWEQEAMVHDR